jgi:hypothetical protein
VSDKSRKHLDSEDAIRWEINMPPGFSFRLVGTNGCEIRDPDGNVIAWTVDEVWAAVIVRLMNEI